MCENDWITRNNVGRATWASISHDHRQRLVLEAIGDRTLTLTEINDEITERIPRLGAYLRNRNVDAVLRKMQALGEIQRNDAPPGKPHTYRRPPLQGLILDLERAFHDDDGAGLGSADALHPLWDSDNRTPDDEA